MLAFAKKTKRDLLCKFDKIRVRKEEDKKMILSKVTNFHSLAWRFLNIKNALEEQSEEQMLKEAIDRFYPQENANKKKELLNSCFGKIRKLLTDGANDKEWEDYIGKCK